MRAAVRLSVVAVLTLVAGQALFSQPAGILRYVNNADPTCQG